MCLIIYLNFMRSKIIPYNLNLKEKAKQLRKNSTFTEILLWNYLKKKQLLGYDFDRQKPIDNYIVDFCCKELRLAIEVDGQNHYGYEEKDMRKDSRLNELIITVLRFDDLEVKHDTGMVLKKIETWIKKNK